MNTENARPPKKLVLRENAKTGVRSIILFALLPPIVAFVMCVFKAPASATFGAAGVALAAALIAILFRQAAQPRAYVRVDDEGIFRLDRRGARTLIEWTEPFGLTVLANRKGTRFGLTFSTRTAVRSLAVRSRRTADALRVPMLIGLSCSASDSIFGGDEADSSLSPSDAEALLAAIRERAPGATTRLYLTDTKGQPVELEGTSLRLGSRALDLSRPVEARSFAFSDARSETGTTYQATWVRQGDVESVFVATLSGEVDVRREANGSLAETRLPVALLDEPPPRELRIAIDHVFMTPIRRALARAPRLARTHTSPTISRRAPPPRAVRSR